VPFPYKMTTICFVGPSAFAPVHSALTLFRSEFEAKIVKRKRIVVNASVGSLPLAQRSDSLRSDNAPSLAGGSH
jgi:hypothetical protein